jgi:hypothetical protein
MKPQFLFIPITIGVLILSGCNTDENSVELISLDFPHGGLRLLVQRDRDARLFYAALPTARIVRQGTFDIDELYQQLQPRLHENMPAENRPIEQPYGVANLEFADGSERNYLIYDEAFAEALLKSACANIVGVEDTGKEIFTAQCEKLGDTTP